MDCNEMELVDVKEIKCEKNENKDQIVESKDTAMKQMDSNEMELIDKKEIKCEKDENKIIENKILRVELVTLAKEMVSSELAVEKQTVNDDIPITTGLSLLAQYNSDDDDQISDTDSVIEVPPTLDYRNKVVEIDTDSDSDDSDSSSGVEYLNEIRKTIEKRTELVDDDEDEEEDDDNDNEENMGKKRNKQKLKVKGEMLLDDLPPIQDLQITVPEEECIEFGKIHSIVDQLLLVTALPNAILLDLETVIFLEKGQKVLGKVFDVLGQVADPLYCIRFNSNKEIKEKEINVGDVVYVAPKTQYTQYVILSSLMKMKGSDASWENDIEPPPRFLDYSDDEQEQLARRKQRNKDRPNDNNEDHLKRPRTSEGEGSSTNSYTPHHRNRYAHQRHNQQGGGNYNSPTHSRYNNPNMHQRQQQPNNNRNSWHSNYYPQQYQGPPPTNYGYGSGTGAPAQNQFPPPRPQNYHGQVPMNAMPPMHTMPYPPPGPYGPQGAGISHMPPQHLIPNSFSIRPPTLYGGPHQQNFTSQQPPPPPGDY